MQFSTAILAAAVAGSASAAFSNSTSYTESTTSEVHTTTVTITSCEENSCTEIPVITGLTTVTTNETIYTTYCPLPTDDGKTTITVTSCEDNVCTEFPTETGVTTYTLDHTVYTTYCPIPETEAPKSSEGPKSSAPHTADNTSHSIETGAAAALVGSGLAAAVAAAFSFLL